MARLHRTRQRRAGQALVEFVFVLMFLVVMLFGLIDFCRAIYHRQILANLSREGSSLYSRGTTATDTLNAVLMSAAPLNMTNNGHVIVTAVMNSNGVYRVIAQSSAGSLAATSRIRNGLGAPATWPALDPEFPLRNQTVYVTEVFYRYEAVTPIGRLLRLNPPSNMYDVAYF